MGNLVKVLMCGCVLAACVLPLKAQEALSEQKKAQNKLLALRAARTDAIRKLAERIRGLRITSQTTVKDFVAESDTINTAMEAFLAGMKEVGEPKFMVDGTCEVTLQVTLKTVVVTLKEIHNRYYKGDKFKAEDFEQMNVTNQLTEIRETGSGAPRPEFEQPELVVPKAGEERASFDGASRKAQQYWMQHCTGRGRLMADEAARRDGQRKLAERIKGVFIDSRTTVKDFVAESDDINVRMDTFLVGSREVGRRYHDNELIVEIDMQVKLRTIYATLKSWGETHYKGDNVKMKSLEELTVRSEDQIIKETGMGIPPERYLKDVPPEAQLAMAVAQKAPDWMSQTIKAVGNAAVDRENKNEAQAKLMAYRGAELDARRKLAEQINGLMITSSTSVRDFVAQDDEIRTSMLAFQQGAQVIESSKKVTPDGVAEVTVEIELRPLWDSIMYYQRTKSIKIR